MADFSVIYLPVAVQRPVHAYSFPCMAMCKYSLVLYNCVSHFFRRLQRMNCFIRFCDFNCLIVMLKLSFPC